MTVNTKTGYQVLILRYWDFIPQYEHVYLGEHATEIVSQGVDLFLRKDNKVLKIIRL